MANLKDELDQYLLLQEDQKKSAISTGSSFKIDMNSIKVPEIKKFFSKSDSSTSQEANSWLKDTQESCCPKLVRFYKNYIVVFVARI